MVVAECTTPAGSETRIAADWYCTNKPNIDVPITLALPNGGLNVPITGITVGANFTPGGGALYSHSTTVALNGSLVGSAIVPTTERIQNTLPPQALVLGGSSPTQLLSLRSTHTNGTHYTVASGFTVTVEYDEHTRTACFTPQQVADAAGGVLTCNASPVLAVPEQQLELTLLPTDDDEPLPQTADGTYLATQGDSFTLNALVSASGAANITDPVQIELTVPRGIVPQGMTIQGEEQSLLDTIFELLSTLGLTFLEDFGNGLRAAGDDEQVTFTYDVQRVVTGQPFPITLDVVGEVVGEYTIYGEVTLATEVPAALRSLDEPIVAQQQVTPTEDQDEVVLRQIVLGSVCETQLRENNTGNAALRSEPDAVSDSVAIDEPLTPGYDIVVAGIHTNEEGMDWYRVIDPANGWLSEILVDSSAPCIQTLTPLNAQGEPIAMPIASDCAAFTVTDSTNVREEPTAAGALLYTIGPRPSAQALWLRILARTPIQAADGQTWYWGEAEGEATGYVRADVVRLVGESCLELPIRDAGEPAPDLPDNYIPEAEPLFELGLNLPEPFAVLPVSEDTELIFTQGYGLNSFAYERPDIYEQTNQIHSGLDFFGRSAAASDTCFEEYNCIQLVAVCSGTLVAPLAVGNGSTSAASGPGLTIRCDNPYGGASNIVVSYNHLDSVSLGLPDGIDPLQPDTRVTAGQRLNVRVHQQPLDARDTTTIRIYPHLHLEVLYTSGTVGGVTIDALRLNPAYFFTPQALAEFTGIMQPFYPVDDNTNPNNVFQFEWEPYDTNDAPERLRDGIEQGQEPDTDLGIRVEENTDLYLYGDVRPAVVGLPDIWARTDRAGIQNLETEIVDIPRDEDGNPVLHIDLNTVLLILLGM